MARLSASETEFIAEHELIAIMPHFHLRDNSGMLNFISGDFGPFQPGITTHVPLWLAIMLKQLNKCRILAPSWLSVDYLTSQLQREKTSEVFEELPFHYLEIASLLLKNAPEDLDRSEHVRLLLEDLQNVRQDKIRKGLAKIASDVQGGETAFVIQMNNISAMEINSVREFMLGISSTGFRSSQQEQLKEIPSLSPSHRAKVMQSQRQMVLQHAGFGGIEDSKALERIFVTHFICVGRMC